MTAGEKRFAHWRLPEEGTLLERVEQMVAPSILAGRFGDSATINLCGVQYHLGGVQDTDELAQLAGVGPDDRVLDTCCFLGGPALQLAHQYSCTVTGIDLWDTALAAARRIAERTALTHHLAYIQADAADLPFADGQFTVVWNQCSLEHDPAWIASFDRVLAPGGRMALTFQHRGSIPNLDDPFGRWSLDDLCALLVSRGYAIRHAEDITARDIEIGWCEMDRRLVARRDAFVARFGEAWVQATRAEFGQEIKRMLAGEWGNGRIVAVKPEQATPRPSGSA